MSANELDFCLRLVGRVQPGWICSSVWRQRASLAGHHADYNNEKTWTQTEVQAKLTEARKAFQNWKVIQGAAVEDEYLLSQDWQEA